MKKIILLFFIFASVALFGQAHLATTYVLNHDGSFPGLDEITFDATSSNAACTGEILTQDSGGCKVYDFYTYTAIDVQTSTFSAWTAGDEITIVVTHVNETTGQEIITLTYGAQDWGSGITLSEPTSNPGEGSGGYTGEPGSQPGDPIYIDVTPIDIPGFGNVNPDVTINPDGAVDITVDVVVLPDAVTPGAPNADLSYGLTFTGDVAGQTLAVTLSYDGFTGTPQFIYWWNGSGWEVPIALDWTVPGQVSFTITMPVGRAGDTEIVLGENDPLPVTLTNFAAEYMQNQFVRVNWTAESECNMNGYILYRSQSDFANVEYSSEIIEANNSPETQIYSFEDYEVEVNDTYHYWIEALDMDGTTFLHGPVSVTINEENGPELPDATVLNSNYPNPFNPVTTISFAVKDGEIAELSIFNAKGQVVLTESFESKAGGYTYTWDASKNGTGVYFYKLQSPSYSNVKKMIMIK